MRATAIPGDPALLERYAAERAPDREAVIRFTDSLVRGFGLPLAPLRRARGHGLLLFDLLRPVKHEFARRTMGLAGRQPRLVRGLPLLDPPGMKRDFDVVVVGGAMAGAGTAALLAATPATAGLRVALVEPRPAAAPAAGAPLDIRVSALSRASQQLLERTGAWAAVAARAAAYRRMVIWEDAPAGRTARTRSCSTPPSSASPTSGTSARTGRSRRRSPRAPRPWASCCCGADFATLEATRDAVRVGLGDGREFRAGLVVGADGAESAVRRAAGIETRGWDYGQRAVVAHLDCERPHAATAWQRFLDTGPLALLPLARRPRVARLVDAAGRGGVTGAVPRGRVLGARDRGLGRRARPPRAGDAARRLSAAAPACAPLRGRARRAGRGCRARGASARGPGHQSRVPGCGGARRRRGAGRRRGGRSGRARACCAVTSAGARPRRCPRSRCSTGSSVSSSAATRCSHACARACSGSRSRQAPRSGS